MSAIDELIKIRGRQNLDPSELHISGTDPVFNSVFKLGEVAAAAHASVGIAVNDIWEIKTGRRQKIQISKKTQLSARRSFVLLTCVKEPGYSTLLYSNTCSKEGYSIYSTTICSNLILGNELDLS